MEKKQVILFIPGYYGSTLKDQDTGKMVWGDTKEILFGRKTLALPINGMKIPGALNLEPFELIPDKQILGGLVKEDAYDRTIALLKTLNPSEVIPVAWDWRRDPLEGARILDKAVKSVKEKYPDHQINLVSHSYGSLMASYYLRYGIQDYFSAKENWEGLKHFNKVILTATPFRGLMAIFRNMHYGIKFGLNHNMQTALAFSTFESSYFLLSPTGFDLVRDENENSISLNLHDPQMWFDNNWGLFSEKCKLPKESLSVRKNYVQSQLAKAAQFHKLMDSPICESPVESKKILYLSGHGQKTVHQGVWHRKNSSTNTFLYYPKNFKKWKSKIHPDSVYCDGDATVPDYSLELPSALKSIGAKVIKRKLGHLDTLQHLDSQKIIFDFLAK